jgi:hypothetical protein
MAANDCGFNLPSAPAHRPLDATTKGLSFPAACRLKSRVETAGESPVPSGIREDVLYSLERGASRSPFLLSGPQGVATGH